MSQYPPEVRALIEAARATLTEQRKEFPRGEIADLDRLEDALAVVERRGTERCGERRQFGYVALSCNREKGHGGDHATAEGNPFE